MPTIELPAGVDVEVDTVHHEMYKELANKEFQQESSGPGQYHNYTGVVEEAFWDVIVERFHQLGPHTGDESHDAYKQMYQYVVEKDSSVDNSSYEQMIVDAVEDAIENKYKRYKR